MIKDSSKYKINIYAWLSFLENVQIHSNLCNHTPFLEPLHSPDKTLLLLSQIKSCSFAASGAYCASTFSMSSSKEPKNSNNFATDVESDYHSGSVEETASSGFWGNPRKWIRSIGAEEVGIERVPEEMRTKQPTWELCTIFFASNCNVTTLATGYLGTTTYGLGWWDSFLCILFFNLLSVLAPAMAATFGPKLGLRTMIIPRYSFGWYITKILAVLNIINQLGWGIVSGITGGEVLYDVGGGYLSKSVAVLIVCLVAMVCGLLGYRVLHTYDKYSWIVMLVCFVIIAGFGAPHFLNLPMSTGSLEAANVFSFGTAIIGFQVAWFAVAADYGVYIESNVSATQSAFWAGLGLLTSQLFMEWLGAAIGTLSLSSDTIFTAAYQKGGIGGLIGSVFEGHGPGIRGFGKFIEVLVSFSLAAVMTTNIYSLGLSVQVISIKLLAVPRFIWSLIGSGVLIACAIAGRDSLGDVMTNFLSMCAYWLVPFSTIVLLEHFIWRRDFTYCISAWDNPSRLPHGFAATTSFIIGTVLSILCMDQEWWIGPIAASIGPAPYGTDISWILGVVGCTVVYIPLRIWERKKWNL
jgi:NCS1 nucleoside transporter family